MQNNGDPDKDKKKKGRVYKDAKDKALQKKMEGKDTPFQNALAQAERSGKSSFMWNGKRYAADPSKVKSNKPMKKATPKAPDTSIKALDMPAPKRVPTKGSEKVLAKDVTGKPAYLKRNKSSAKSITKRLKKRRKQRGY